MEPTDFIVDIVVSQMGQDSVGFGHALTVGLILGPYTPDPDNTWTDIANASFTGSTFKSVAAATRVTGVDPATGDRLLVITEPAGGWNWLCTVDPVAPQEITGLWIGNSTVGFNNGNLVATQELPVPITIDAAGQMLQYGTLQLRIPVGAFQ